MRGWIGRVEGALDITEKNRIFIIATGMAVVRTLSTREAALMAPPASRSTSPSSETSTRCVRRLTTARSIEAWRNRWFRISLLSVVPSQAGSVR